MKKILLACTLLALSNKPFYYDKDSFKKMTIETPTETQYLYFNKNNSQSVYSVPIEYGSELIKLYNEQDANKNEIKDRAEISLEKLRNTLKLIQISIRIDAQIIKGLILAPSDARKECIALLSALDYILWITKNPLKKEKSSVLFGPFWKIILKAKCHFREVSTDEEIAAKNSFSKSLEETITELRTNILPYLC